MGAVREKHGGANTLTVHAALAHGVQQAGGESSALAIMADGAEDVHGAILSTGLAGEASVGKDAPLRGLNLGENWAFSVVRSLHGAQCDFIIRFTCSSYRLNAVSFFRCE